MQKDEIIRLARKANLPACHASHPVALGRFAALVAAAEREACAKVCEEFYSIEDIAQDCAAAIRARKAALAEPQIWVCPEAADTHRYDKPGHCEDCGKTLVQIK